MKGKTPNVQAEHSKQPVKRNFALSQIFKDQPLLGWQILDIESTLYSEMEINIESIATLTSLYMKAIEKLNSQQDPRQRYFNLKMQKLMGEPYVIRCFNNTHDHKKSALQSRRKELEQTLEKQVERQNHRKVVQQVIVAQEEKEKKMMSKVKQMVQQSHRHLEDRIKRRNEAKQMRNSLLHTSQVASERSMNTSCQRFGSTRSRHDRMHNLQANSSFQLYVDENQQFRELKRELQEEQAQQRLERIFSAGQHNVLLK